MKIAFDRNKLLFLMNDILKILAVLIFTNLVFLLEPVPYTQTRNISMKPL